MTFRVKTERERDGWLIRFFIGRWSEVAYIKFALSGLQLEIEFPSDWHEEKMGWVRIGLGLAKIAFAFPWSRVVPDDDQCSGPTYGFNFFDDGLHLHWGKMHGTRNDPFTIVKMPWAWRHRKHEILSGPTSHTYTYTLRSGELQKRTAFVREESRLWVRPWFPYRRLEKSISVDFDDEVGERTGSWKGGVMGCGYEMKPGETAQETLRRMERERLFS